VRMFDVLETISSLRKYEKRAASLAAQCGKAVERRFVWWLVITDQSPPFVCPPIWMFPLSPFNLVTFDLDLLHVCMDHDHCFLGIEGQGHMSRSVFKSQGQRSKRGRWDLDLKSRTVF